MISIFAKLAFLNTASNVSFISKEKSYKGHGHLQRVSSMIRADQIAKQIKAKLNPTNGYEKDICLYVKPHIISGQQFKFEGQRSYIDIIDGWGLLPVLREHPEVGVIACSKQDFNFLSNILNNKIVFIPQHHCNFERVRRDREGITVIGIIGTESAFKFLPQGLEEELAKRKIKLLKYSKFFSREDIVDFYQSIDIQLVWRPYRMRLSNPLKIVNAASFGIPTIAFEEEVFSEMHRCYLPVKTLDKLLDALDLLIDSPDFYDVYSRFGLEKAEQYHIENVAKLYKQL